MPGSCFLLKSFGKTEKIARLLLFQNVIFFSLTPYTDFIVFILYWTYADRQEFREPKNPEERKFCKGQKNGTEKE